MELYHDRPLLEFSREEISASLLTENKLEFVEDSSNQSIKYTRNFFRHEIIPAIRKVYPQVKENLRIILNGLKKLKTCINFLLEEIKKKLCKLKAMKYIFLLNN